MQPRRQTWLTAALALLAAHAAADIGLEFRSTANDPPIGQEFTVDLYAVADTPADQYLSAIEAIFTWPPSVQLVGLNTSPDADLIYEGFPSAGSSGLNEANPPADGDALYIALASLGTPVPATSAGTRITSLRFLVLSSDPNATFHLLPTAGNPPTHTVVFSGITPNLDVTGNLTGITLGVGTPPCSPADVALPYGVLNFFDVAFFIDLYNAADPAADLSVPFGTLNFFDIAAYIDFYILGCP
ncbi:MAG: hypothetical protein D6692_07940 [Planctomycetota bacterium]|nr:MAG: hypothetical protein D6692_07940 [Planctomycetota bacterium]